MMKNLTAGRFAEFYRAIHGDHVHPHPWQMRLARDVIERGGWPQSINIPTGCGKTSCIDIAVYALACDPKSNPRRIVFAVNRRVVVDGAHERARLIARKLEDARSGILRDVRDKLCDAAGCDGAPLVPVLMRGGTHIDKEWHANPAQPCVISTTVDQAGSRLLFRGYGVGRMSRVVEAGLLGRDCLWILDETHISQPFTTTLRSVEEYNKEPWAERRPNRPWHVVEMTATPTGGGPAGFELDEDDRSSEGLSRVLGASKVCDMAKSRAKDGGDHKVLADDLAKYARSLHEKFSCRAVAVVANRVATAKLVHSKLKEGGFEVHLLIGRMRPWDRDAVLSRLAPFRTGSPIRPEPGCSVQGRGGPPPATFVVSTQCLEVGADLDFDGMVSEASSLDSLRQRFGRLNRAGRHEQCRGTIVAPTAVHGGKSKKDSASDPIYGDAAAKTWAFLARNGRKEIDFGIDKMSGELQRAAGDPSELDGVYLLPPESPELLPSHVDLLCQTQRNLLVSPDVAPFLHGFERGVPTVSVVWRSGFCSGDPDSSLSARYEAFAAALEVLPPRSAESMPVPLWSIRRYLEGSGAGLDSGGDAEWQRGGSPLHEDSETRRNNGFPTAFVWRGKKEPLRRIVRDDHMKENLLAHAGDASGAAGIQFARVDNIRPNDVVIISADSGGWNDLGHVPDIDADRADADCNADAAAIDIAEKVAFEATGGIAQKIGGYGRHDVEGKRRYRVEGRIVIRMADDGRYPFAMTDEARRFRGAVDSQEPRDTREKITHEALETIPRIVRQLVKKGYFKRDPDGEHGQAGLSRGKDVSSDIGLESPAHSTKTAAMDGVDYGICDIDVESMTCTMKPVAGGEVILVAHQKGGSIQASGNQLLEDHMQSVADSAQKYAKLLDQDADIVELFCTAALLHDAGKADGRFQQMLYRSPLPLPADTPLLAKDNGLPRDKRKRYYPAGFRHELVSSRLAESVETTDRDLLLHLIESHHGYCRPNAPPVADQGAGPVEYEFNGAVLRALSSTGLEKAGSGASRRFWACTRKYGWWGLAWIEALFLLADWDVSGGSSR